MLRFYFMPILLSDDSIDFYIRRVLQTTFVLRFGVHIQVSQIAHEAI
jgi:hypothetical protein